MFYIAMSAAERHALGHRVWKRGVMFTTLTDVRWCLFTVWIAPALLIRAGGREGLCRTAF